MICRQERGKWAEKQAAKFLKGLGYEIIDRNVRFRFGEIDIVASKDNQFVFVEVRFRKNDKFGDSLSTIDAKKRSKLKRAILLYINQKNYTGDFRCDAIGIDGNNSNKIEHIQNIYI